MIDFILHIDSYLVAWAHMLGPWLYVILFLIVFCETGLVVTPFLPGDSLLFAVGALSAVEGSPVDFLTVSILLVVAALTGDVVNYNVGYFLGQRLIQSPGRFRVNPEYLKRTEEFYGRHGGKTILLARFAPILRTLAPFVAGLGRMEWRRYLMFSFAAAVIWVATFVSVGHFVGNLPLVKERFHFVVIAIVSVSLAPAVIEFLKVRFRSRRRKILQ